MIYLCKPDEYEQCKKIADDLILVQKSFPEQVFKIPYQSFTFLEFEDVLYKQLFIDSLKNFLRLTNEKEFWFAVIQPDPEEFFLSNFSKYPAFRFGVDESMDEYFKILETPLSESAESMTDTIELHATRILITSISKRWAFYADRDFEVTVAGFATKELYDLFTEIYGKEKVFSDREVIDEIFCNIYPQSRNEILNQVTSQFVSNYATDRNN